MVSTVCVLMCSYVRSYAFLCILMHSYAFLCVLCSYVFLCAFLCILMRLLRRATAIAPTVCVQSIVPFNILQTHTRTRNHLLIYIIKKVQDLLLWILIQFFSCLCSIIMYVIIGTQKCIQCNELKNLLHEKGIQYN